jgi:hypothetical protein
MQLAPENDTSDLLDDTHKHRIQEIVGLLLYCAHAVDNKLLVALSAIAAKQAKATITMEQVVHLLLDYMPTYPHGDIVYQASNMILCVRANAGFLNKFNLCSHTGAHILLSEDDPFCHRPWQYGRRHNLLNVAIC